MAGSPCGDPLLCLATQPARARRPWDPDGRRGFHPHTPDGTLPQLTRRIFLLRSTPAQGRRKERLIANRKRNICISFRLTPEEREQFTAKQNLSGLTRHDFLMELLRKKKITLKPGADNLVVELKRIGNNLNQLARRANSGQLTDCRTELRLIRDEIASLRTEWQ